MNDPDFTLASDGALMFRDRLCVPDDLDIQDKIVREAHSSEYSLHPGSTKMYKDLKQSYWWPSMKVTIALYVATCLTCQKVKAERHRPYGTLQPLPVPEWKWERITMDFVTGLPSTPKGMDAIWVIVDRLTKTAHFIPIKTKFSMAKLAQLYMDNIVRLHGVPVSIVSIGTQGSLPDFGKAYSVPWDRN